MTKIPVYFMPGLAASSTIFEYIALPKDQFEMVLLDWFLPENKETLQQYALRMTKQIKHENPVLIGVSFGGILVQEMSTLIPTRKTIIISSVKSNKEFPAQMLLAKKTLAYKLIPTSLLANIETLVRYAFGENIVAKRIKLYEKYLSLREKSYLDWSIENVISWSRTKPDENVVHIHGDKDGVFPIDKIKNCIVIKGGTHIMIINKFKWFNENLPTIITN
jgi:pimeloyl-ACP methyl ester carboxylesterase